MAESAPYLALDNAVELHRTGRLEEAAALYQQIISQDPDNADAHALLGYLLFTIKNFDEAERLIKRAISIDPSAGLFYLYLANIAQERGDHKQAIAHLQACLDRNPEFSDGWLNLSRIAEQAGDYALAEHTGSEATRLAPQNPGAWLALGVALTRQERHDEALQHYQQAAILSPEWADAWDNIGLSHMYMNRLDDAEQAFRHVIDLCSQTIPDDAVRHLDETAFGTRHWHLSQLELMKGDYWLGFGRYRCRFSANGGLQRMDYAQPVWKGEDIRGKTLMIMDEEGRGDGLMMARYIPLLRQHGVRVIFYIRPVFATLFRDWYGADNVIVHGEDIGHFDYYCWVLDLPYLMQTTLDSVPDHVPYLPILQTDAHSYLGTKTKPRIGLVWAGSAQQTHYKRQIPLETLAPMIRDDQFDFYNLTRDKREGDDELLATLPITDLAPRLRDFADLSRFVDQMDLIISCDTATPHLAGGMGKPCWVLLSYSSDWRWLTEREDSPWYPTLRLFRQSAVGDWSELIDRVYAALSTETFQ
ncbi:MAG: tetratricopeptide repeat protein [Alphaproteobacteria bacterium]|nr:tetratricopeptide repeat protein [Alphaproteobacteria bacterium]